MTTQAQAANAKTTKIEEADLESVIGEVKPEKAGTTSKKPGLFNKAKTHVSENRGKYAFAAGCAVGAAAALGYSIWKTGAAAPEASVIIVGDAPAS